MEVYVFIQEEVYDLERNTSVEVFSTEEKAKEKFDSIVAKEKKNAINDGWEMEEEDRSFEAWEDDRYAENHISVSFSKLTVQ